MGIDVMIVALAEDIASRPSRGMLDWLDRRIEDFSIRYGYVELRQRDIASLEKRFADDPVGQMLLKKVASMKESGERAPYVIELMVGG